MTDNVSLGDFFLQVSAQL